MTIKLVKSLNAYQSEYFAETLKKELESLPLGVFPLAEGAQVTGYVDEDNYSVSLLSTSSEERLMRVRVGVFFTEVLGGCSCSGDPGSDVTYSSYCQMELEIDRQTAETKITVLDDE